MREQMMIQQNSMRPNPSANGCMEEHGRETRDVQEKEDLGLQMERTDDQFLPCDCPSVSLPSV